MAWILRNLSHFDFFPKNLKKGLTSWSGCDIIKSNLKFEEGMREKEYLFKSRMT